MKFRVATLCAAAGMVAMAAPANAAAYCTGTLTASYVMSNGAVIVNPSYHSSYTQLCNLKVEWKGITPDVCVAWMAKADAAVTLGRTVTIYYSAENDCAALPTYGSAPAPYYVMLR